MRGVGGGGLEVEEDAGFEATAGPGGAPGRLEVGACLEAPVVGDFADDGGTDFDEGEIGGEEDVFADVLGGIVAEAEDAAGFEVVELEPVGDVEAGGEVEADFVGGGAGAEAEAGTGVHEAPAVGDFVGGAEVVGELDIGLGVAEGGLVVDVVGAGDFDGELEGLGEFFGEAVAEAEFLVGEAEVGVFDEVVLVAEGVHEEVADEGEVVGEAVFEVEVPLVFGEGAAVGEVLEVPAVGELLVGVVEGVGEGGEAFAFGFGPCAGAERERG